jgi:hypothetical protein
MTYLIIPEERSVTAEDGMIRRGDRAQTNYRKFETLPPPVTMECMKRLWEWSGLGISD